jgi:tRNA dimethylallyltransferase
MPKTPHNQIKVIIILGPTAVGKSSVAVEIATKVGGEIISADSRQVYRHLNIGTGKITSAEMRGIPHHLIDIIEPHEQFTALDWKSQAAQAITDIHARGKIPIICGGTGFYISSLIDDIGFPDVPAHTEEQKELELRSPQDLFTELQKLDPVRASSIDMKNTRRLARAIIIARTLGSVPLLTSTKKSGESSYETLEIGLILPDSGLRSRIHARLVHRIEIPNEQGVTMLQEAEHLHTQPPHGIGLSFERMEDLGLEYRYLAQFLQMKLNQKDLINILSVKIWQYARRQKTWWRKDARIKWYSPMDLKEIEKEVDTFLK